MPPKLVYADALKKIRFLYQMRTTVTETQVDILDTIIKDYTKICTDQLEIILVDLKNEMEYLRKVENEQAR